MAYNFLACHRDQAFLLPPDVRDWHTLGAFMVRDVDATVAELRSKGVTFED
jgi:hypothetical protein